MLIEVLGPQPFAFGYYVQGQFSRSGLAESAFAGVKNIVVRVFFFFFFV
jgi:hypothetical protein